MEVKMLMNVVAVKLLAEFSVFHSFIHWFLSLVEFSELFTMRSIYVHVERHLWWLG